MVAALPLSASPRVYQRHRPEATALYEVVRDNIETRYGAIDDGAIAVRIPWQVRMELEAYLNCGLLCRGFARLKCEECDGSRLVAFSCKGRGFCPSCTGRRMNATAANLIERVPPETGLRQWVLTFPFAWRGRLAQDGALLGNLTRIFVDTVHAFYADRAAMDGHPCAKTGSVTVVQRTSWPEDFLQRVKGNLDRLRLHVNALFVACGEGSSAYGKPETAPVSHRPSLPHVWPST